MRKEIVKTVDNRTFARVFDACMGWIDLFVKAQDILREMEKRKIVPFDMFQKVQRINRIEELPRRYRKEVDPCV